jgi:uncharacterized protein
MANNNTSRSGRGFAGMDPEQQREIARKGGKAAHEKGTAHEFDSAEAQAAGSKGGKASHSSSSNTNKTDLEIDTDSKTESNENDKASHSSASNTNSRIDPGTHNRRDEDALYVDED